MKTNKREIAVNQINTKELKRNPKDRGFGYKKACEYPVIKN